MQHAWQSRLMRVAVSLCAVVWSAAPLLAQDDPLLAYRGHVLGSRVDAVVKATNTYPQEVRTVHTRPGLIQELEWRAGYDAERGSAESVRTMLFTFVDDALYRIVVTYHPDRTDGLAPKDMIAALSAQYGVPRSAAAVRTEPLPPETMALARWDGPLSSLTLVRGIYTPQYQLVFVLKAAGERARVAMRQSYRLDALEAPQRARDAQAKRLEEARAARDKTRETNRTSFTP